MRHLQRTSYRPCTTCGLQFTKIGAAPLFSFLVDQKPVRCPRILLGIDRKDDSRRGTKRGEEDPVNLPGMLDEYYYYRGCSEDGLPTRKRFLEIGLGDVAEALAWQGKLADDACPAIDELLA